MCKKPEDRNIQDRTIEMLYDMLAQYAKDAGIPFEAVIENITNFMKEKGDE